MADCVYLQNETSESTKDGRKVFGCLLHEKCTKSGTNNPHASCENCKDRLTVDQADCSTFVDNLFVIDNQKHQTTALRGLLQNVPAAFVVAGGPSIRNLDENYFNRRGVFSLGINNVAAKFRLSAFTFADPPKKFHNGIWQDPTIMKLCPTIKLTTGGRGTLREKTDHYEEITCPKCDADQNECGLCGGTKVYHDYFKDIELKTQHCPNVWGFERRSWFSPDATFFTEPSATWGNNDAGVRQTGESKTMCSMLMGIRLLYYMGIRRIYLAGVDFWMNPEAALGDNYAFPEKRLLGEIRANNQQYATINQLLRRMVNHGVFRQFGLEVFNCNAESGLRAFEHVPLEDAMSDVLCDFPKQPFDLSDWYIK